jgi:GNAT superfamily N-acetyltransferase
MHAISLRETTHADAPFALQVTEACMRGYAEQTWGKWTKPDDFDPAIDKIIQIKGRDVGLMGVDRQPDFWFLDKFYVLPAYQNRGVGGYLLSALINAAKEARVALRLTVLEVNPARALYERHGFVLTDTVQPRHYMEWRSDLLP